MTPEFPPDEPPRIVKPRKPNHTPRSIIALTPQEVFLERLGTVLPASELPAVLVAEPSSIIAVQGFGPHLARLLKAFGDRADFQYRATPQYRHSTDLAPRATQIHDTVINFVGFRNTQTSSKGGKRWSKYHYPLDPIHFVRTSIGELYPEEYSRIHALLEWAKQVREWCECNQLEVKPSAGGLAAQLLRDSRFFPAPRRKAPRLINDSARSQLPGNYYHLLAPTDRSYDNVLYLDMTNAHHAMASGLQFPNVDNLRAYGHWSGSARKYAPGDSRILQRHGLFRVHIRVPHIPETKFPPPFMDRAGDREAWVYSSEISLLHELGGKVLDVIAHYTAPDTDSGLNRYAKFAMAEIRRCPTFKPWLKPVLHSAYGALAARPTRFETGYYRAKGGERKTYAMGIHDVPVLAHAGHREIDSRIANVIHRGMIEAAVRKEVLWFARYLTELGEDVLAIYADSLFIRHRSRELRFLPPPWRVAEACTNLRFLDATRFLSPELTRLPGLPRNKRESARADKLIRQAILIDSFKRGKPQTQEVYHHARS